MRLKPLIRLQVLVGDRYVTTLVNAKISGMPLNLTVQRGSAPTYLSCIIFVIYRQELY